MSGRDDDAAEGTVTGASVTDDAAGHGNAAEGTTVDASAVDERRRSLLAWAWRLPVLAAVGGGAYGLVSAYRIHFAKIPPAADPVFVDRPALRLAEVREFSEPWAAVEFVLSGLPAVAVRLEDPVPGGTSVGDVHLAAFSRVCTHRACLLDLTREPEAIAFAFNHRTDRPQLTCSCHYSVFDPVRAGRAVSGPAVEPLPRVRLRVDDGPDGAWVVADGVETRA